MLSSRELERYSRQVPIIGVEGQKKLKEAKVMVVGVGGLGSAASYYLVAAGIGRIYIVDDGVVEESNLQRQILYTVDDIGKYKVDVASDRLRRLNPYVEVVPVRKHFDEDVAEKYFPVVDLVIDALDNWEGRLVIDRFAHRYNIPFIHAGVQGFYGQLTVIIPGKTPCLRCIFPKVPTSIPSPLPVMPTTPGVLGVLEANEAIKLILGKGETMANKLLVYDGLTSLFEVIELKMKKDNCSICY